jgi:hypothetical protein
MAPESNGSFCDIGAKPTPPCAKRSCNISLATCTNYSNVLTQPVLNDGPWTAGYVQSLNATVPVMVAGIGGLG